MGRPEGKALLERPRRRWEYNIKRDLEEVDEKSWTRVFWLRIGTGGAVVIAVIKILVPLNARNFLTV
jgi:hypothetical protein